MSKTLTSAYSPRKRSSFFCTGESKTKQSHRQECDINYILQRHAKTGLIDHVNSHRGNYDDLSDVPTYHEAQNVILLASNSFNSLTSTIRKQFNNDPALFLDFVSKPENKDAMIEMGLLNKPAPEPKPVPVILDDSQSKKNETDPPEATSK